MRGPAERESVLITGANRGLGLALAAEYSAHGWRVHACCRHVQRADALHALSQSRSELRIHRLDVTRSQDADRLGQLLASERLDLLVNNAAADDAHGMSLATVDAERWKSVFATNVIGPALVTRALVPALRLAPQPAVVNLGSRQGSITSNSSGGRYAYRTSKAALSMLTKTLALDLRDFGITCVSVHPGWVRTELGGPEAPLEAGQSAAALRVLIAGLDRAASGTFLDYTGESIPW